jgi:hypothetical protein
MIIFLAPLRAGQAQHADPAVSIRASECVRHLPAGAFTRVAVYAFVDLADSVSAVFASTADNFMQELVLKTEALLGAKSNVLPKGDGRIDWLGIEPALPLTAFRDGRIVARYQHQPVPTAAGLMATALDSISTVGMLEWSADSARDSIRFSIAFVRPVLDSGGHVTPMHLKRTGLPLLSILAPWQRGVSQKPGSAKPHYPELARKENYEGTVILSFLVDTTGHAVDSTIKDVWPASKPRLRGTDLAQYDRFVWASTQAVRRMEFVPASIGGCNVKQLVQMPFVYGLNR